jgi:hypothetical protein
MAFFIALFLTFFAEAILLSGLQLDFVLPIQLLILFVIACIAGLTFAVFAGKKVLSTAGTIIMTSRQSRILWILSSIALA